MLCLTSMLLRWQRSPPWYEQVRSTSPESTHILCITQHASPLRDGEACYLACLVHGVGPLSSARETAHIWKGSTWPSMPMWPRIRKLEAPLIVPFCSVFIRLVCWRMNLTQIRAIGHSRACPTNEDSTSITMEAFTTIAWYLNEQWEAAPSQAVLEAASRNSWELYLTGACSFMKASATSATSCHPWSMASECPFPSISRYWVTPAFFCCRL